MRHVLPPSIMITPLSLWLECAWCESGDYSSCLATHRVLWAFELHVNILRSHARETTTLHFRESDILIDINVLSVIYIWLMFDDTTNICWCTRFDNDTLHKTNVKRLVKDIKTSPNGCTFMKKHVEGTTMWKQKTFATLTVRNYIWIVPNRTLQQSMIMST